MGVLVGKMAPDFICSAVNKTGQIIDNFRFSDAIRGKYALLFFYPLDFTFVCPSELLAVNNRIQTFQSLDVEVFGISIDSKFAHLAWRSTPIEKGGIGDIQFTLLSDVSHQICRAYDVETPDGIALRAAIIIDKEGIVQSEIINSTVLGRNIDEIIRTIEAIQFYEQHGEVCPVGWKKDSDSILAN